ncbi:MAG: bifunctional salicylyl-CoA 5-hydroxylase/oxidoreductase [Bradymonadia bacterium]
MSAPLDVVCIGGGPAGVYLGILLKQKRPEHRVRIYERNRADDTFGFGVVFSDETLGNLAEADPVTYGAITAAFAHWDDIHIHYQGEVEVSTGHGFSGLARQTLLDILYERAATLGVELIFEHPVEDHRAFADADLIVACDGVNSGIRGALAEHFQPTLDWRPNRFVWLGTTRPFSAFTFYFKENAHGLWRVHAYQYDQGLSTFIVEATEETWRAAGLHEADEDTTAAYCAELFAEELEGHPLLANRSIWRQFPTVSNARWHHENVVLLGDAAHTAHFSIGSGTKLAMEDAIALVDALEARPGQVSEALEMYEEERRTGVESTQRAAQVSLQWFEETERYFGRLEPLQFAFSLLTRSLRITHENLRLRDPEMVARVDQWHADRAEAQSGVPVHRSPEGQSPPPLLTPFKLRDMVLPNRVVVSPMCQYSAEDGMPNDWHLVHLGSRAIGGAGLIITEMTDVSAEGRITPGCAGMYSDAHVTAWGRIVDFVHQNSETRMCMQLAHAGRKGSTRVMWEGMDAPLPEGNWPLLAPSAIPWSPANATPKAMTRADMDAVRDDFVSAAQRAEAAGFDMIELHLAHGYLLSSFLTPLSNQRTDAYGGSLENRMRFPLEVFEAIRAVWPQHKPMSARISGTDWVDGAWTPEDAVALAGALQDLGCDIVDVSAGQTSTEARPRYGRLFQTPFSDQVRHEAQMATMTVGNISSYADANSIIAAGRADLCALARVHLFDPYWTRHAAHELGWPMAWPKQYCSIERYTPRMEWSPRGQNKP